MTNHFCTVVSLSFRYLTTKNKESAITFIKRVTFISIAIASCALSLIFAIAKGLEQATYTKIKTIYPQLIIDAHGQELNTSTLEKTLYEHPSYQVDATAPEWYTHAMISNEECQQNATIVYVKGIVPDKEKEVSAIAQKIIAPASQEFSSLFTLHGVVIGAELAKNLSVNIGNKLTLIFPEDDLTRKKVSFQTASLTITGIFKTGIQDFDERLVYCSFQTFNAIFEDAYPTQLYVRLQPHANEKNIIQILQKDLNLHVYSWEEMYESILSALTLEKYALLFILFFILIITSSSIISLLFMTILQKQRDIALMQCLGMQPRQIKHIFLAISFFISFFAAITGQMVAYIIGYFLQTYQWITLPENVYYTTHLPIELNPYIFLKICCSLVGICFLASLLPLKKLKNYILAQVIRNQTS